LAGQPSIAHSKGPAPPGSPRLGARINAVRLAANLDLVALAVALAVFAVAGFSILGYAVCAGAWLSGRAIHMAAERHAGSALARGNRRAAMGTIAAATLGRVWLVALAILLVGLADREAGLAAAVLAAVLVTCHLAGRAVARLSEPEADVR
jgi:hypothetical protein